VTNVARTSIAEPAEQATGARNTTSRRSIAEPAEQATGARNTTSRTSIAEPAEQATGGPNTCVTCGDVAVPMRVMRTGADGLADCIGEDGETAQVDLALLDAAPGDEVLVHACVAIQRLGS
jgi:hydrogenase expression/formation protein HypC